MESVEAIFVERKNLTKRKKSYKYWFLCLFILRFVGLFGLLILEFESLIIYVFVGFAIFGSACEIAFNFLIDCAIFSFIVRNLPTSTKIENYILKYDEVVLEQIVFDLNLPIWLLKLILTNDMFPILECGRLKEYKFYEYTPFEKSMVKKS